MEETMLRRIITASAALALTAGLAAGPAKAHHDGTTNVHADSTTVTFSLAGNGISIDAPTAASGSGSVAPLAQVTATLGNTTVSDNRGTLLGWVASATASDLVDTADSSKTIPAAAMSWNAVDPAAALQAVTNDPLGTVTDLLGARVVSKGAGGPLGAVPVTVAVASVGAGGGSYTYGGSITLTVPVAAEAGTYQSTVTQTVL